MFARFSDDLGGSPIGYRSSLQDAFRAHTSTRQTDCARRCYLALPFRTGFLLGLEPASARSSRGGRASSARRTSGRVFIRRRRAAYAPHAGAVSRAELKPYGASASFRSPSPTWRPLSRACSRRSGRPAETGVSHVELPVFRGVAERRRSWSAGCVHSAIFGGLAVTVSPNTASYFAAGQ
jgi:hypothetical protein